MQKQSELPSQTLPRITLRPLLLDIEQAMAVLAVGKSKIYELIEYEGLPAIHLGKSVRFSYKALEQWVDERTLKEIA